MKSRSSRNGPSATEGRAGGDLYTVRVRIQPRDRGQLGLVATEAAQAVRAGFGASCVEVADVATRDGAWTATASFEARKSDQADQAALLTAHREDRRLWNSWVESLYTQGLCDVLE